MGGGLSTVNFGLMSSSSSTGNCVLSRRVRLGPAAYGTCCASGMLVGESIVTMEGQTWETRNFGGEERSEQNCFEGPSFDDFGFGGFGLVPSGMTGSGAGSPSTLAHKPHTRTCHPDCNKVQITRSHRAMTYIDGMD